MEFTFLVPQQPIFEHRGPATWLDDLAHSFTTLKVDFFSDDLIATTSNETWAVHVSGNEDVLRSIRWDQTTVPRGSTNSCSPLAIVQSEVRWLTPCGLFINITRRSRPIRPGCSRRASSRRFDRETTPLRRRAVSCLRAQCGGAVL